MRLQELFLTETTEEDRALISLAGPIFSKLSELSTVPLEKGQVLNMGTIGELFDTPINILDPVKLSIWTEDDIIDDFVDEDKQHLYRGDSDRHIYGLWDSESNTIIMNYEFIASNAIKSVITHELRHALDDYKSGFKANSSKRYSTPKNKEHRKDYSDDPYADNRLKSRPYRAKPAEINARFSEVLQGLTAQVKHAAKKVRPENLRDAVLKTIPKLFDVKHIADLFPEKEKSRDYKRLMKRAADFVEKEVAYHKSLPRSNADD